MALNTEISQGVNESNVDSAVLSLNNIIDGITKNMNDIDMIIYNLDSYLEGEILDTIKKEYDTFRKQYEILIDNLNSYPQDLMNVKSGLKWEESTVISQIDEFSDDLRAKTKDIKQ